MNHDHLTFNQLEQLLDRTALNENWRDLPIVMTEEFICIRDVKLQRSKGNGTLIILLP